MIRSFFELARAPEGVAVMRAHVSMGARPAVEPELAASLTAHASTSTSPAPRDTASVRDDMAGEPGQVERMQVQAKTVRGEASLAELTPLHDPDVRAETALAEGAGVGEEVETEDTPSRDPPAG